MTDLDGLLPGLFAAGDAGDTDSFISTSMTMSSCTLPPAFPQWDSRASVSRGARPRWLCRTFITHHEVMDVLSRPGVIAARTVVTGTMRGSYGGVAAEGRSFKVDQAVFAYVRDDKIAELWEIVDVASAREQLSQPR